MAHSRKASTTRQPPTSMTPLFQSAAYLSSWRGQLVICFVVLIIGLVIFAGQGIWMKYKLQFKERSSKIHLAELISMEDERRGKEKEVEDVKAQRGREKKREKELRKRKGSLLKLPVPASINSGESSTAISSIESSPAPVPRALLSTPAPRPRSSAKGKAVVLSQDSADNETPTKPPRSIAPESSERRSPTVQTVEQPRSQSPWEIPLPPSPIAGPSRLPLPPRDIDAESTDGEAFSASESALSNSGTGESTMATSQSLSSGFSIIPEEGYLPPSISAPSTQKKKRRKGRAPPTPLPLVERRLSTSGIVDNPSTPTRTKIPDSPSVPITPSRQARKASLTRPMNADLEELLTEREKMIETLRAEIGMSKAEEAKAREDVTRAKATEERLNGDFERVKSAKQRSENEARKREGELNARLTHLSTHYTAALHRINALEAVFRDGGHPFPPASPGVPPPQQMQHLPTPIPIPHIQPMLSPMPPSSPYGIGYGPSPRSMSASFIPYPSPGLYPSPMLHPHMHPQHSHSPSPFRRSSTTGIPDEGLAGPLTPGHGAGMPQAFPFEMGIMPSPRPPTQSSSNGQPSADELRRMSIESSVLKKKVKEEAKSGSESGEDASRSPSALENIKETENLEGLGMGEIGDGNADRGRQLSGDGSASSHPSSPSPPTRASVLLTPASAEVYHRALVQGTDTPEEFARRDSLQDGLSGIKLVPDIARGNIYYTSSLAGSEAGEGGSDNASAYEPREEGTILNGNTDRPVNGHSAEEKEMPRVSADFVPMFASLAHTPQQLAEIQRMTKEAMQARATKQ